MSCPNGFNARRLDLSNVQGWEQENFQNERRFYSNRTHEGCGCGDPCQCRPGCDCGPVCPCGWHLYVDRGDQGNVEGFNGGGRLGGHKRWESLSPEEKKQRMAKFMASLDPVTRRTLAAMDPEARRKATKQLMMHANLGQAVGDGRRTPIQTEILSMDLSGDTAVPTEQVSLAYAKIQEARKKAAMAKLTEEQKAAIQARRKAAMANLTEEQKARIQARRKRRMEMRAERQAAAAAVEGFGNKGKMEFGDTLIVFLIIFVVICLAYLNGEPAGAPVRRDVGMRRFE